VRSAFQLTGCPKIGPKPQIKKVDSYKKNVQRTSSFWSILQAYGIPPINDEEQGTQIGPGFDLIITPLAIDFRPQETTVDSKSVPLQTETPREQPTQQKTLDKEPQRENNSPRKVLLQNQPSAMQTGLSLNTPAPMSNTFLAAKTTTKNNRTVKNATIENSSIQRALQILPPQIFSHNVLSSRKEFGPRQNSCYDYSFALGDRFHTSIPSPLHDRRESQEGNESRQILSEGDQNITIQIWNPQGAAEPVPQVSSSQAAKKTVVHGTTSIFVKNVSKNQKDCLQQ
jgi:hypothetical protein